ncbi:SRPBCC family protein, partial [Nocardia niigatensis]
KHFQRHVMTEAVLHSDDIVGWHGEIHDSEVVEDDQTARRREQADTEDDRGDDEASRDEETSEIDEGEVDEQDEEGEDNEADEPEPPSRPTAARRKTPVARRSRASQGASR